MFTRICLLISVAVAALALTGNALAKGGNYSFDGGTAAEQANVRAALNKSGFNWSLVQQTIVIHIKSEGLSAAAPGGIWLDSGLLDSGRFAWGTVMHEYAHQVDFFLLDPDKRALLTRRLGGKAWWQTGSLEHRDVTGERFASTLAWSYWVSRDNTMRPGNKYDEAGAMKPRVFRALLRRVLSS